MVRKKCFTVPTQWCHIEERMSWNCARASHARIHTEMMKGTWFIATSPPTVKWLALFKKQGIYSRSAQVGGNRKNCQLMSDEKSENPPSVNGLGMRLSKRPSTISKWNSKSRAAPTSRQNLEGEVDTKAVKCKVKIGAGQKHCCIEVLRYSCLGFD